MIRWGLRCGAIGGWVLVATILVPDLPAAADWAVFTGTGACTLALGGLRMRRKLEARVNSNTERVAACEAQVALVRHFLTDAFTRAHLDAGDLESTQPMAIPLHAVRDRRHSA